MTMPPLNLDYFSIAPELVLSIAALSVMAGDAIDRKQAFKRQPTYIALAGIVVAIYYTCRLWGVRAAPSFAGMIATNDTRLFFAMIFLLVAALTALLAFDWIEQERMHAGEFYTLLLFATSGMLWMAAANDLVIIFLGLEILSISTYVLAGFRKDDLRSNEAAMKYFIPGSFSTAFLLYGIALTYGALKTTHLDEMHLILASGAIQSTTLLFAGAAMMLVGFGFKIASVPFHFWAPDVYQGAPSPITGFMAAGAKAAAFAAFISVFISSMPQGSPLTGVWTTVVTVVAVLTMTLGNLVAIAQSDIKRMLAYSSIAHAGYALLGFLARDTGAVAFYLLAYSLMTVGSFAIVTLIAKPGELKTRIDDFSGIGFRSPGLALALSVFMLSLGGVPLTAGFLGKFLLFRSAWSAGMHALVIIAVLNSAVSFYYYLRVIVAMYFNEAAEDYAPPSIAWPARLALALCLIGTLYLGILPGRTLSLLDATRFIAFLR